MNITEAQQRRAAKEVARLDGTLKKLEEQIRRLQDAAEKTKAERKKSLAVVEAYNSQVEHQPRLIMQELEAFGDSAARLDPSTKSFEALADGAERHLNSLSQKAALDREHFETAVELFAGEMHQIHFRGRVKGWNKPGSLAMQWVDRMLAPKVYREEEDVVDDEKEEKWAHLVGDLEHPKMRRGRKGNKTDGSSRPGQRDHQRRGNKRRRFDGDDC